MAKYKVYLSGRLWCDALLEISISAPLDCEVILEINKNAKITKCPQKTGRKDRRIYYTFTQGILPVTLGLRVLCAIAGRVNDIQKAT